MAFLTNKQLIDTLLTSGIVLILILAFILLRTLAHYYTSYEKKIERALQLFSLLGFSQLAVNLIILFFGFRSSEDHQTFQANVWLLIANATLIISIVYSLYARYKFFHIYQPQPKHRRKKD
ncbi:hypothetical protein ACNAN0_11575 [Agrilactobacillus fermenti]|uniref:hypothetical protein n=1 Tax=Agrilactobacillus fermenti TaxID=2586909 RepID=UPI001E413E37|nr:hypothetical protein [Agrilactobacillus fermenti]MCD2255688.1 hypothetical protein [Agrilactobacillus fermenti]